MTASKNKPTGIRRGAGRGQRGEAPGEGASTPKAREAKAAAVATGSGRYMTTVKRRPAKSAQSQQVSTKMDAPKEANVQGLDMTGGMAKFDQMVKKKDRIEGDEGGESFQGLIGIDHLREIVADASQDPQLRLTAASKLASIERHAESHTSGPISRMPRAVLLAEIARIKAELEG